MFNLFDFTKDKGRRVEVEKMVKKRFSLSMILLVVVAVLCLILYISICGSVKASKVGCIAGENHATSAENYNVIDAQNADGVGESEETTILYTQVKDLILYEYLMFVRDGAYPTEDTLTNNPLKENDFVEVTKLDLSDVRDGEHRITSVDDLGLFNFAALKELDLKNNNLTQIRAVTFERMTNLDTLNLEGNALTTLDFGNLQSLKKLYANNNSLTSVDLSILAAGGQASLCYNQIADIRKLNLQSDGKGASVDVYGNKIDNFINEKYGNYNLIIGFQYEYVNYNEKSVVKIYKTSGQENYYLDCVNVKTNAHFRVDDASKLAPATYEITMCDENGALGYKVLPLKIEKSAPTFVITDNAGNELDVTKVITKETKIAFNSNDSNYKVVYSINGTSFVEGNTVTLNKSGTYSFCVYAKSSVGDNSQTYSFTIELQIRNNNFFQMLGIIMAIFAFAIAVYGVMFFLNRKRAA